MADELPSVRAGWWGKLCNEIVKIAGNETVYYRNKEVLRMKRLYIQYYYVVVLRYYYAL